MTEELLHSEATKVYNQIVANQQKVANIFINFFGKDYVDYRQPYFSRIERRIATYLSKGYSIEKMIAELVNNSNAVGNILVYFPKVTVTNEHNNSIEVTKLFVNTGVTASGSIAGEFGMTRGEYTLAQWRAGYIHSHCSHIPSDENFASCCLGTGPIRYTIALLANGFDEDRWNLYCFELSEYVKVESIRGIPYNRLENVVDNPYDPDVIHLRYNLVDWRSGNHYATVTDFWKYYIRYHYIPLSFCNGNYSLAVPPTTFFKDITSKYIDFLNTSTHLTIEKLLQSNSISGYGLRKGVYIEDTFHDYTFCRTWTGSTASAEGGIVCYFKGRSIRRHIINDTTAHDTGREFLLDIDAVNTLLTRTLFAINYGTTKNCYQINQEFRIL